MAPLLADHVTAGLNEPVPVTVAVKARVAPGARLTHVGLTDTPVMVGAVAVTVAVKDWVALGARFTQVGLMDTPVMVDVAHTA